MGWRVTWQLTCDECGTAGPRRYKSRTPGENARRAALAVGWVEGRCLYGLYLHLCPGCAAKPRPDWWPTDAEELTGPSGEYAS